MEPNYISSYINDSVKSQKKGYFRLLFMVGLIVAVFVYRLFYLHNKEKQANQERDDQNQLRANRFEAELAMLRLKNGQ